MMMPLRKQQATILSNIISVRYFLGKMRKIDGPFMMSVLLEEEEERKKRTASKQ
jgi:hypothetical protein